MYQNLSETFWKPTPTLRLVERPPRETYPRHLTVKSAMAFAVAASMALARPIRRGVVRAARQLHTPAVVRSPAEQHSKAKEKGEELLHMTWRKQELGAAERQSQDPFDTSQPLSQVAVR